MCSRSRSGAAIGAASWRGTAAGAGPALAGVFSLRALGAAGFRSRAGAAGFGAGAFAGAFARGFFSAAGLGETGFLPEDEGRFFSGIY